MATERPTPRLARLKLNPLAGPFRCRNIEKSDTEFLPFVARAVMVGTQGNVKVLTDEDEEVTFPNVTPGTWLQTGFIVKVFETDTEPTEIVVGE